MSDATKQRKSVGERIGRWISSAAFVAIGYVWARYGWLWAVALDAAVVFTSLALLGALSMLPESER